MIRDSQLIPQEGNACPVSTSEHICPAGLFTSCYRGQSRLLGMVQKATPHPPYPLDLGSPASLLGISPDDVPATEGHFPPWVRTVRGCPLLRPRSECAPRAGTTVALLSATHCVLAIASCLECVWGWMPIKQ